MAKRTPPTPDEITAAFEAAEAHARTYTPASRPEQVAFSMTEAARVLATEFRTTRAKATEWLLDIAASDVHPVEIVEASAHGTLFGLLRRNDDDDADRYRFKRVSTYDEYGGTIMDMPSVDLTGHLATAERGQFMPKDGDQYVIRAVRLAALVADEIDERNAGAVHQEAHEIISAAGAEHERGQWLDYLRGLLTAAQVPSPRRQGGIRDAGLTVASRQHARTGRTTVRVEINLYDGDIDRLGRYLRNLGVDPVKPDQGGEWR
jgi:hypothetical protein